MYNYHFMQIGILKVNHDISSTGLDTGHLIALKNYC